MIEWISAMESVVQRAPQQIYTLVGTEFTLIKQFISALQVQLQGHSGSPVAVHRFYYEETGTASALAECQTLSLFAEESVVVLENCLALTAQAKGKQDVTELEQYIQSPAPEHVLVITCHAEKLDERKKISKLLKKFPIINCNTPKEAEGLKLIARLAKDRKLEVEKPALAELWRRTQSVTIAERELEKFMSYTDGVVKLEDVVELTPRPTEDNVFRWIEGVIAGKLSVSFDALQDIQQSGYDAFALFALMARQLRLMWFAKVLGSQGRTQREIAAQAGAHPFAVKMAAEQSRRISAGRLEELLCIIADSEFMVKSGRRDVNQALDWIVLSCANAPVQSHAVRT